MSTDGRTNVDGERLRFIAVGHRAAPSVRSGKDPSASRRPPGRPDGRYSDSAARAKLPVMITDETIYLGDHPTLAVVCHRRWKCDSAIMWSCIVVAGQPAGQPDVTIDNSGRKAARTISTVADAAASLPLSLLNVLADILPPCDLPIQRRI